jgi:TPR repeat protein
MVGAELLANFTDASSPLWAIPGERFRRGAANRDRLDSAVDLSAGWRMKKWIFAATMLAAELAGAAAMAGPWEDGMAAYNRGDYVPAFRLFRPLAEQGNARAQTALGVMLRKGQGVPKNLVRAQMWFSLAARRGDVGGRAGLSKLSRTLTQQEISQADAMANVCEASNYRQCEY